MHRSHSPFRPDRRRLSGGALSLFLLGGVTGAGAQDAPKPPATPAVKAGEEPKATPKPEAAKPEPAKDKDIDETVKEHEKLSGIFTFYRKKKGTSDTLLMEVPDSKLGQLLMLQATASTGASGTPAFVFHGAPLNDLLFRIEKGDDGRVRFVAPKTDVRVLNDAPGQRSLLRSYPDTILQSFEIKARQPERHSVLIDVSDLFRADIAEFAAQFDKSGYALDRGSAYVDKIKVLPENVAVRTVYQFNRKNPAGEGPRTFPFAVSYDLYTLPQTSYRPRLGDTRVGYFTDSFKDLSDAASRDQTVNYIRRWNLEKADPKAALSPPKKPIVFWIDNAVPEKYRQAVREGLLMWNPAFERVGIKDAIVVKQMPDDADWDIADVRYNVVRWTTGMPFAIALMRSNPLTGEILNASINMDAGFASSGAVEFDSVVDPTAPPAPKPAALFAGKDGRFCDYAYEARREAYFGEVTAEALQTPDAPFNREAFIHSYIREIVAHELGHNLGLRHNFIASTESDLAQLGDPKRTAVNGVSASVMDYLPPNIAAVKKPGAAYFSSVVGTYDKWAIEYGYRPIDGAKTPADERPVLARIASQCNLPGHAFQTDEVADQYDPLVTRFDLGKDPLDWTSRTFTLSRYLLFTLDKRHPKPGESYYDFTREFNVLVSKYLRAGTYTARFIGGQTVNSSYPGDPNSRLPLTSVDGAKQQRALQLLNQHIFAEGAFAFPKRYLSMLTSNPNAEGNQADAKQREFPMFTTFANYQRGMVQRVFAPAALTRLANSEFRAAKAEETLTMATLFRSVGDEVWSELRTGKEISALRRSLQIDHLNTLIDLVMNRDPAVPSDAVTLGWEQLRVLRGQLKSALPKARGEYGPAHLREAMARIDRVLEARTVAKP